MNERNLALHYLITLFTSGFYAPFWSLGMANDLNTLAGEERIKTKKLKTWFIALITTYLLGFAAGFIKISQSIQNQTYESPSALFFILMIVALTFMVLMVRLNLQVSQEIANYEEAKAYGKGTIIAFTLIYFVAFPLLQAQLNKLANQNQSR